MKHVRPQITKLFTVANALKFGAEKPKKRE